MLDNMFVFEFDLSSEKIARQYNKYKTINKFKLHDFYRRSYMSIAERPFDKVNV